MYVLNDFASHNLSNYEMMHFLLISDFSPFVSVFG